MVLNKILKMAMFVENDLYIPVENGLQLCPKIKLVTLKIFYDNIDIGMGVELEWLCDGSDQIDFDRGVFKALL